MRRTGRAQGHPRHHGGKDWSPGRGRASEPSTLDEKACKEVYEAKLRATEMLRKAPLGEKSAAIHLFMVNESDSRRDSWTDSLRDILSNK